MLSHSKAIRNASLDWVSQPRMRYPVTGYRCQGDPQARSPVTCYLLPVTCYLLTGGESVQEVGHQAIDRPKTIQIREHLCWTLGEGAFGKILRAVVNE